MCTLHNAPSAKKTFEYSQAEKSSPTCLIAWLSIALVMLLKVSLLLAFCYLHASMEEAPHEDSKPLKNYLEYQKKTLC